MSNKIKDMLDEYLLYDTKGSTSHSVYCLPVSFLKDGLDVETWKHNRPVDLDRVIEIRSTYKKDHYVNGTICLGYRKGKFFCYDGNHRYFALSSKYIDKVIVDIMWNVSHGEIESAYSDINKSISVPELYGKKSKSVIEIRGIIDIWMTEFCNKYESHSSKCNSPNRPNFNRSKLTNEIIYLYKEYGDKYSIKQILRAIVLLNKKYREGEYLGVVRISSKCLRTGLYLFCAQTSINEQHLAITLRMIKKRDDKYK